MIKMNNLSSTVRWLRRVPTISWCWARASTTPSSPHRWTGPRMTNWRLRRTTSFGRDWVPQRGLQLSQPCSKTWTCASTAVTLVGMLGNGKSICGQLLQQLYELNSGDILMENHDLLALNMPLVWSKLSIVSQEPVLFNRSLAETIPRRCAWRWLRLRARQTSTSSSPTKTNVGTQLSSGQKQMIAIARLVFFILLYFILWIKSPRKSINGYNFQTSFLPIQKIN